MMTNSRKTCQEDAAETFLLFACCLPVKGARRSIICDLQRRKFHFIPNGLYEILMVHRGKTLEQIEEYYGKDNEEIIEEYFEFLASHELGFWTKEPESFPSLDLTWDRPERITNAIIDVDYGSQHNYEHLFAQLDELGCKALELRFFRPADAEELNMVLHETRSGRLRSISLLVSWSEDLSCNFLRELVSAHPRIQSVTVHTAPEARQDMLEAGVPLQYRREAIDSPSCCGQVHSGYFVVNIETFTESQSHNSCLNRKLAIDAQGEIKNCPSLERSFGNAQEVSLLSAVAHRDFPQLWMINKDQIDVCKDCEFRYICTDCRAYISESADLYSKPAKCKYDPYQAEWTS